MRRGTFLGCALVMTVLATCVCVCVCVCTCARVHACVRMRVSDLVQYGLFSQGRTQCAWLQLYCSHYILDNGSGCRIESRGGERYRLLLQHEQNVSWF